MDQDSEIREIYPTWSNCLFLFIREKSGKAEGMNSEVLGE